MEGVDYEHNYEKGVINPELIDGGDEELRDVYG